MRTKATLIFTFVAAVAGFAETASSKFLEYNLLISHSLVHGLVEKIK